MFSCLWLQVSNSFPLLPAIRAAILGPQNKGNYWDGEEKKRITMTEEQLTCPPCYGVVAEELKSFMCSWVILKKSGALRKSDRKR